MDWFLHHVCLLLRRLFTDECFGDGAPLLLWIYVDIHWLRLNL